MRQRARQTMAGMGLMAACVLVLTACSFEGSDTGAIAGTSASSSPAEKPPSTTPTPRAASAVIVVAGLDVDGEHVTVSGYVDGLLENGGKCTFVFTGTGAEISVDSTGIADRMTTSCGSVQVPAASFTPGSWNVTLNYTSTSGTVTSAPQTLEI